MITLTFFAESPFDNRRISDSNLQSYTSDHFQRLKKAWPEGEGPMAERIAATEAANGAFNEAISQDLIAFGNRKGAKVGKVQFRKKKLRSGLRRFEAFGLMALEAEPRALTLLFPKGRDDVARTPENLLKLELKRIAKTLRDLQPAIPPEIADEADVLLAEWLGIHLKSREARAQKSKREEDKRAARKVLSWELYLNILEIARLFPNDKRAIERFSVQSLLGFTKPRGNRRSV